MTNAAVDNFNLLVDQRGHGASAGRQHILSDLCLKIPAGRVTWLVGESGAGKSTFCDLFAGLPPAGARITGAFHWGQEPVRLSTYRGRRRLATLRRSGQLAWAPQNPADTFAPHHRLRKWFGPRHGTGPELADFGLAADMLDRFPQELSGGQISRLSLAAALQHDPALLVCDEPTAGLDPDKADTIIAILEHHAAVGHSVLAATHDLSALARAATESGMAAVIFSGHIVETCPLQFFLAGQANNPYSRALAAAAPTLGAVPLPFACASGRRYRPGDEILRLERLHDHDRKTAHRNHRPRLKARTA